MRTVIILNYEEGQIVEAVKELTRTVNKDVAENAAHKERYGHNYKDGEDKEEEYCSLQHNRKNISISLMTGKKAKWLRDAWHDIVDSLKEQHGITFSKELEWELFCMQEREQSPYEAFYTIKFKSDQLEPAAVS